MRLLPRTYLAPLALALLGGLAPAQTTWHVPGDFPDLNQALAAAVSGDTIVVGPGTWPTQAVWINKTLHVKSSAGPNLTILDGTSSGRILTVNGNVGADSRIEGFTFYRGFSSAGGALSLGTSTSPVIENCIFRSNRGIIGFNGSQGPTGAGTGVNGATGGTGQPGFVGGPGSSGGAVYIHSGSPTFLNCVFYNNEAGRGGSGGKGGTGGKGGPGTLFVSAGQGGKGGVGGAGGAGGEGGAIANLNGNPVLINCFFRENHAGRGGNGGHGGNGGPGGDSFWGNGPVGPTREGTDGAQGGRGGALAVSNSITAGFTIVNCTFVANRSGAGGVGGLPGFGAGSFPHGDVGPVGIAAVVWGNNGPSLVFANSIFRSNVGSGAAIQWLSEDPPEVSHCVSDFAPLAGSNNIQADPLFDVNGSAWTPHGLLPGSPCIDAADASFLDPSVLLDVLGNKRRLDDPNTVDGALAGTPALDIGSAEYQPAATFTLLACALNPSGSLQYASGSATPGGSLQLTLDNPVGSQGPSLVFGLVGVGGFASEANPCGLPVPGLGMAGPGASGGLAVDLGSSATLPPLFLSLWTGAALDWDLVLPNSPELFGLELLLQGAFIEWVPAAVPIALTEAALVTIGS